MSGEIVPWNRDRAVGERSAFTPSQVIVTADDTLSDMPHDRCLFMVGIDSFLRCGDLLRLKVQDVQTKMGLIKTILHQRQQKTRHNVHPVLTPKTREAVAHWIKISGKNPNQYLFTRFKPNDSDPISDSYYRRLVKRWARAIGLDDENYSTHSLRRSKAIMMYRQGVPPEDLAILLGHKSAESVMAYLGLTVENAQKQALKHDIFKPSKTKTSSAKKGTNS